MFYTEALNKGITVFKDQNAQHESRMQGSVKYLIFTQKTKGNFKEFLKGNEMKRFGFLKIRVSKMEKYREKVKENRGKSECF